MKKTVNMRKFFLVFIEFLQKYWYLFLAIAVIFIIFTFLPGFTYWWSIRGFYRLFFDDLGFDRQWSGLFSVIFGFIYAALLPLTLRWFIFGGGWIDRRWPGRRWLYGFLFSTIAFGTTPILHAIFEIDNACRFDQRTGKPLMYFVVRPGGEIVFSDSPGVDPATGIPRQPCASAVASVIQRQRKGLVPHRIVSDPRQLTYFDRITGRPLIWYFRGKTGEYRLFDAEGFDPETGQALQPVTNTIVSEIENERASVESQADVNFLSDLFGTSAYPPFEVIIGIAAQENASEESQKAANMLTIKIISFLQEKKIGADQLRYGVYKSKYWDGLINGDGVALDKAGLTKKSRAVVVGTATSDCKPIESIPGLISCEVTTNIRVFKNGDKSLLFYSEYAGSGATADDAINNAVERIVEEDANIFGRM